jgi:hypothetical protein
MRNVLSEVAPSQTMKTPRQRIALLTPKFGRVVRTLASKKSSENPKPVLVQANASELPLAIAQSLSRSVIIAAEKLGLDPLIHEERLWLLAMLAWSIYGAKNRGRAKAWVTQTHAQLLADVEEIRRKRPDLKSEEAICKELRKAEPDRYADREFSTIRRQLQHAKKLKDRDIKEAELLGMFPSGDRPKSPERN